MRRAMRGLAIVLLACSMPLACMKYPWLPATVSELLALHGPAIPRGSSSYQAYREHRLRQLYAAMALYGLGTASLGGLVCLSAGVGRRKVRVIAWAVVAGTTIGVMRFEDCPRAGGASGDYVALVCYLTGTIALLSSLACIITVVSGGRWGAGQRPVSGVSIDSDR